MRYGTRYRIKSVLTRNMARKRLNINLDIFIQKLVYKYNLPASVFEEWKYCILKDLCRNFEGNSEGVSGKCYNGLKESIRELQNNFITTYIDKANTNYAIICETLYGKLLKEAYGQ